MEDLFALIVPLGIFLFLIALGLFAGGATERRHLHNLERREQETQTLLTSQLKSFPYCQPSELTPTMLSAEVVISSDYLKSFLGVLRNLFGGEIRSFQSLLERARREALLRLKEQAAEQGFDAICNVRLETADLAGRGAHSKNKLLMACILATATAYSTHRGSTSERAPFRG